MDEGIFERLRSGDETVLREIDQKYRDWIVGALGRKFGDLRFEDLEECFNDALKNLWEYRDKLDERAKPSTLLYLFASRRSMDRRRREQAAPKIVNLEDWSHVVSQVLELKKNGVSTEDPELKRLLEKTLQVLDSIEPRFALILRLDASGEGVACSEDVSQATGISKNQVPVYRARARKVFERKLREFGVLPPERKGRRSGN